MNTQNQNQNTNREQLLASYIAQKQALETLEKQLFFIPDEGETYYYVEVDGAYFDVHSTSFNKSYSSDKKRVELRNCFRTCELAEKALEAIKQLFISVEH